VIKTLTVDSPGDYTSLCFITKPHGASGPFLPVSRLTQSWLSPMKDRTKKILRDLEKEAQTNLHQRIMSMRDLTEEGHAMARNMMIHFNKTVARIVLFKSAKVFLSPYDPEWKDKLRFFHDATDRNDTSNYPTIHKFMDWYCDSRTIKAEISGKKTKVYGMD
jgi:hypothetical protein